MSRSKQLDLLQAEGVLKCSKCGEKKVPEEFSRSSKSSFGRVSSCKACQSLDYKVKHIAYKKRGREGYLRRNYGITTSEFEKLVELSGEMCGCCGDRTKLYVDHCHDTGNIRGLLCQKCNSAIGLLGDRLQGVQGALNYLEEAIYYGCLRDKIRQ